MNDNLEKKPKRIGAFKEFKIFMTEYVQVIMGKKKDLLISIELYRDLMNLVGLTF